MTNIVVLIKQVPDTWSERKLSDGDYTLDREAADAVLDEINERAVEEALLIKEAQGGEVKVLSAGPDRATDAIRKALSMGADSAVHLNDPSLHGSDAIQTGYALAAALGNVAFENDEPADLIIAGNEATDGRTGAVPAIIAEYLQIPALTQLRQGRDLQVFGDDRRNCAGAAVGGLVTRDDEIGRLVVLERDVAQCRSQGVPGLDGVGAVQARVVEVYRAVRTHRQSLADRVGGAIGACGQNLDLTALSFLDEQGFFDGPLVDLVENGVCSLAIEGVVTVAELALGPCVWNLLDQNNDVRHGSASTSWSCSADRECSNGCCKSNGWCSSTFRYEVTPP